MAILHQRGGNAPPRYGVEMFIGGLGILVVMIGLTGFVLLIAALIDLVGRPAAAWAISGQNQVVWVLIVIFLGFFGPLLYLAIARPALAAAQVRPPEPGDHGN